MQKKIMICDSDERYRKLLKDAFALFYNLKDIKIFEYDNGKELFSNGYFDYDAAFIALEDLEPDGNEIAKQLRVNNYKSLNIFCSNQNMFRPESIKVIPFRYLIKHKTNEYLYSELKEISEELNKKTCLSYVSAHYGQNQIRLCVDDINYITKYRNGCRIFVDKSVKINQSKLLSSIYLDKMYQYLEAQNYEYAHSSYIVNMNKIIMLNGQEIILEDETLLTVSRSRYKSFVDRFEQLYQLK